MAYFISKMFRLCSLPVHIAHNVPNNPSTEYRYRLSRAISDAFARTCAAPPLSWAFPARTRFQLNPCTISAASSPGTIDELNLTEAEVDVTFKYVGLLPPEPASLFSQQERMVPF